MGTGRRPGSTIKRRMKQIDPTILRTCQIQTAKESFERDGIVNSFAASYVTLSLTRPHPWPSPKEREGFGTYFCFFTSIIVLSVPSYFCRNVLMAFRD